MKRIYIKMDMDVVKRFIDEEGKIAQLPAKGAPRLDVLEYLAEKFETNRDYKEREVNAIIIAWHTFEDYFLLRRELIDHKLLKRTPDGSRYWKEEKTEE